METITPRISRLDRDQVTAETGTIYDRYLQQRGNVPKEPLKNSPIHNRRR